MKGYFKRLLVFTVFLGLSYPVFLTIWANIPYSYLGSNLFYRQGSYGHLNTRLKEIPKYGEVDMLFVGSSRIYRGIDPRIFKEHGIKVFVLGSSSQTPLQSYVLLSRYLDELNPKLVVFDVLPSSFSIEGIEPTLDLIANDKIDQFVLELANKQNDILVWNTLLYAFIRQISGIHDDFRERVRKSEEKDTYIPGGYVEKVLSYNHHINCDTLGSLKWNPPLNIQIDYFRRLVELLKSRNISVRFINMPLAHYKCYENNDLLKISLLTGLDYVDYNEVLNFNDSLDFYDNYHLNQRGVLLLDRYLIKEFKK